MKRTLIKINRKTGQIEIKTEGFTGSACLDDPFVKKLEEGLGLRDAPKELTPEFYNEQQQQQELGGA